MTTQISKCTWCTCYWGSRWQWRCCWTFCQTAKVRHCLCYNTWWIMWCPGMKSRHPVTPPVVQSSRSWTMNLARRWQECSSVNFSTIYHLALPRRSLSALLILMNFSRYTDFRASKVTIVKKIPQIRQKLNVSKFLNWYFHRITQCLPRQAPPLKHKLLLKRRPQ